MFFGGVLLVFTVLHGKGFSLFPTAQGCGQRPFPLHDLSERSSDPEGTDPASFIEVNNNLVRSNSHG